ncbi:hypothetical protein E1I69_19570 [Bacillus timonensis]|uniref:Glycerophosphoryl diester phosphodiesterase membrane domain-containing protein n=1 Tax=Bacillus timonensis TaxID=1033734 RepID=A0A4S3PMF2_9BACI|nr:hypothetical protein [Bacillus timonensis]THE10265.1 hypothetical protein E1I69_19570 [Bacillus timonensis]
MNTKFSQPKGFGEILDLTFSLSKKRFRDFFTILLIFMGPVYILEALILFASGTSFFREVGPGEDWISQIANSFDESVVAENIGLGGALGTMFIGILGLVLFPVAEAALLIALNHIRKNEEYTISSVIKKAFSRFWAMLGSNIVFGLIVFGFIFVSILIIVPIGIFGAIAINIIGVLFAIVLGLGLFVGLGYLLTRWGFYFGSVVLDYESPGLSRSWHLSKKRGWILFGLYIVFFLIISAISFAVEATFSIFLGNSVLLSLIVNFTSIFTTLLFAVGYGVMYLDAKVRHDAEDLDEMIEGFNEPR